MKKKLIIFSAVLLSLANVIILSLPAKAQVYQSLLPTEGEGTCKWAGETCPSGTFREVCLKDGSGSTCTCGDVTRSC
jgi:hypothetical protein